MSGPAVHHIVARKVIEKLSPHLDPKFANEILNGKFNPYLNLGSQGPDWLFFLSKDWDPNLNSLVHVYLEIDHFIEDLKEKILAVIPPELIKAVDDLKQAANDVEARSSAITVIKESLERAKNVLALMEADLFKFTEKYVTDSFNIFDLVTTAYHDVPDLHKWWWFDTLHYRRTGEFAKALLRNSKDNTGARAFALGYATHYATDTVGHPFVNTMVGGPYRTHAQRHKFVENHHDVWAWKHFQNDEEFIKSKLGEDHYKIEGNEDFLPDELKEVIIKSIKEIYYKNNISQYGTDIVVDNFNMSKLAGDDLDNAFQLWLGYFKRATNVTDLPEPVPYSFSADAAAILDKFKNNVGDIGDAITNPGSGSWSLLSIFEAIALAIISPFLLAAAALDFLIGELENLAAAPINYFLSYIYEKLYTSFKQLHYGLALNGLAFPFKEQLDSFLSIHTTDSSIPDIFGNTAQGVANHYPMKKFHIPGMEGPSHLVYPYLSPGNTNELSLSTAAPQTYYGKTPEFYIQGELECQNSYFKFVSEFTPSLEPEQREKDFEEFRRQASISSLGNAVDYSTKLLRDYLDQGNDANFPNFNLDSDRGYGFKGWRRVKDPSIIGKPTSASSSHDLIDVPDTGIYPFKTYTIDKDVPNSLTDIIQPNSNIL